METINNFHNKFELNVLDYVPINEDVKNHKIHNHDEILDIEEALKHISGGMDIAASKTKTPVAILQELLCRRCITPKYELVQIEGAIHEPTFRYRVSVDKKDAIGAGRSKREAKHAAAKKLILELAGTSMIEEPKTEVTAELKEQIRENGVDEKVLGNPIGWLQELCMAKRWPPPTYEMEKEVGLPHEREFTAICKVMNYEEAGTGKSKKIAKRVAAFRMRQLLQDNNENHQDPMGRYSDILKRYDNIKDTAIPTSTNEYSFKVSQFHKTLKITHGKQLAALQAVCLNSNELNFVEFLQCIAHEQHFEVTYVEIEELSYSGRYQCLVQLSTLPVAVCQGSGVTPNEAQSDAAHNALEYLKIMAKK